MVGRQRFRIEYVQSGTGDGAVPERFDQGGFLNDRSARCVYQIGVGFHLREIVCAKQSACAIAEKKMDGQKVGLPEEVLLGYETSPRLVAAVLRQVMGPAECSVPTHE